MIFWSKDASSDTFKRESQCMISRVWLNLAYDMHGLRNFLVLFESRDISHVMYGISDWFQLMETCSNSYFQAERLLFAKGMRILHLYILSH